MQTTVSRLIALAAMTFVLAAAGCGGSVDEAAFKTVQKQSAESASKIQALSSTAVQLDSRIEDVRAAVENMQKDLKLVSTDVAALMSKGGAGSPEANKELDQRLRTIESNLQKLSEQLGSRPARSEEAVEPQDAQAAPATPKAGSRVRRSSPATAARTYHLIKQGETLDSIARDYGVSADQIRSANHIPAGKSVPAGQRILIPKS